MESFESYLKDVYAGVVGKVAGVYMGRPIEGWSSERIKSLYGSVDRYLAPEQGNQIPLADDDISGTFTFIKSLADSGLYSKTPGDFFGKTWLNYLIEKETVLWWGGAGVSTEHTAYLRLKSGIPSPRSGSSSLNGKVVSEQIGAQIFIDAFGMVSPGNPVLAAALAEKAARVSHDGEAVNAAKIVAAMVSLAFTDKDIHSVMDKAVEMIPRDCAIAQVHRDVRAWAKEDGSWEETLARIKAAYGYDRFGGGCHVMPNHAVMVMAWAYSDNNFHKAQTIANSAGWDTDCNAANVGAVMGIIVGIEGIDKDYPYHALTMDKVIIPTADGTGSVTDCLRIARDVALTGWRTMGRENADVPAPGPIHDFSLHGALHGYSGRGCTAEWSPDWGGSLLVAPAGEHSEPVSVQTPVTHEPGDFGRFGEGSYRLYSTPFLYDGMDVSVAVRPEESVSLSIHALSARSDGSVLRFASPVFAAEGGKISTLKWKVGTLGKRIDALSVVVCGALEKPFSILSVDMRGEAKIRLSKDDLGQNASKTVSGFISNLDWASARGMCKNEGIGVLATGNRSWQGCRIEAALSLHSGDEAGVVLNYQGLLRHYRAVIGHGKFKIIRSLYGDEILLEEDLPVSEDEVFRISAKADGGIVSATVNGKEFSVCDSMLSCGGAGIAIRNGFAKIDGEISIAGNAAIVR